MRSTVACAQHRSDCKTRFLFSGKQLADGNSQPELRRLPRWVLDKVRCNAIALHLHKHRRFPGAEFLSDHPTCNTPYQGFALVYGHVIDAIKDLLDKLDDSLTVSGRNLL
jgi:hypothetical protein